MALNMLVALIVAQMPLPSLGVWRDCSEAAGVATPQMVAPWAPSDSKVGVATGGYLEDVATLVNHGAQLRGIKVESSEFLEFNSTWLRYATTTVDLCAQRPDACPLAPNGRLDVVAKAASLAEWMPEGRFRVTQLYRDAQTAGLLGCIEFQSAEGVSLKSQRVRVAVSEWHSSKCDTCKQITDAVIGSLAEGGCAAACVAFWWAAPLCGTICAALKDGICNQAMDCADKLCHAMKLCSSMEKPSIII